MSTTSSISATSHATGVAIASEISGPVSGPLQEPNNGEVLVAVDLQGAAPVANNSALSSAAACSVPGGPAPAASSQALVPSHPQEYALLRYGRSALASASHVLQAVNNSAIVRNTTGALASWGVLEGAAYAGTVFATTVKVFTPLGLITAKVLTGASVVSVAMPARTAYSIFWEKKSVSAAIWDGIMLPADLLIMLKNKLWGTDQVVIIEMTPERFQKFQEEQRANGCQIEIIEDGEQKVEAPQVDRSSAAAVEFSAERQRARHQELTELMDRIGASADATSQLQSQGISGEMLNTLLSELAAGTSTLSAEQVDRLIAQLRGFLNLS